MIKKIFAYVKKYRMIEEGGTVIAGVSGGADSVCLLFVLQQLKKRLPFHLAVVHVNHGIREDAGEDAAYVEGLCKRWDLPFYLIEKDVKAYAKAEGLSEEEAGRKIRYQAFADVLQKECSGHTEKAKIAVAHNRNDRAETMLFHLFRGTGLTGAGGIRPVNGNIIRPLLCVEREEIEDFLTKQQITWQMDSTNEKDDYTRNRIRHHILPVARESVCRGAVAHMNQAADDLQAAEAFIQKETALAGKRCIREEAPDQMRIDIQALRQEDDYLQGRILLSCLEKLAPFRKDITAEHIANIRKLLTSEGSREIHLPYRMIVLKKYDQLILKRKEVSPKSQKDGISDKEKEYDVSRAGKMEIPGLGIVEISVFPYEKTENIPRKTYTKWFDYDKITASACFRIRRTGDYLTINSRLSRKSLQDYFVNEKIPKQERDSFYVLADRAHIMWVPGYRISEQYKVSENTKTILQVKVMRDTEEERSHENG